MLVMPRPRKPYVQKETSRHGRITWYFRKGDGPRVRLHGDYESPEWLADYDAALGVEKAKAPPPKALKGTLGWLVDRYMESVAWSHLAPSSQKARRAILKGVKATGGELLLAHVDRGTITAGRDRRAGKPYAPVNFVKAMKGLFKWAAEAQHISEDPAAGIVNRAPKSDGHHTWTIEEVFKFWEAHPLGTRPRLAMDILIFAGMRSGDAVRFGPQHVRDGWGHYRSGKTSVEVDFPILPPLQSSIDAARAAGILGDFAFLTTKYGRGFKSSAAFGNWFRRECIAAKVPGRAHGLRKAGPTIAAENGATDRQIMAMWGWTDARTAGVYTRKANRRTLAAEGARLMIEGQKGNILSPHLLPPSPHLKKEA